MNKSVIVLLFFFIPCFSFSQDYQKLEEFAYSTGILENTFDEEKELVVYMDTLIFHTNFLEHNSKLIELKVKYTNRPEVYISLLFKRTYIEPYNFEVIDCRKYKNELLHGLVYRKNLNNTFLKSYYKEGEKEGSEFKFQAKNGDTTLIVIREFRKGKEEGWEHWFYDNGMILKSFQNKNGTQKGIEVNYYETGVIKSKGKAKGHFWFVRNKKSSEFGWHLNDFTKWVKSQELKADTYYGIPEYLPQNFFRVASGYKYSKRIGKWSFYDENGDLIMMKKYNRKGFLKKIIDVE